MIKKQLLPLLVSLIACPTFAQQDSVPSNPLDVAFETRSYYYMSDSDAGIVRPDDHFGSNNYLNIGYSFDKFKVGIQYEAYMPMAQGYGKWYDSDISMKYLSYQDEKFQFVVGDFQEQFGSGLTFCAYENRKLGINTSLEGIKGVYNYGQKAQIQIIYGRPRYYMERMDVEVRGANVSLALNEYLHLPEDSQLRLEGSYVNRYEVYTGLSEIPENVESWSARTKYQTEKLRLSVEYVQKSNDVLAVTQTYLHKGKALLVEAGYTTAKWDMSMIFRRMERMYFASARFSNISTDYNDWLNYIPSLTRQHTRSLATMYPYLVCPKGEIGGQLDLNYRTADWRIRLNGSCFYRLNTDNSKIKKLDFFDTVDKLYHDFNIDIVRRWDEKWESSLFFCNQSYNPLIINRTSQEWVSNIIAVDLTCHLDAQKWWKVEAQHLVLHEDTQNWMALKAEYQNKKWQFYVSDAYNYGNSKQKIHYYKTGLGYVSPKLYVEMSAGRHYAEYQFADGMCRNLPAYTGVSLAVQKTF